MAVPVSEAGLPGQASPGTPLRWVAFAGGCACCVAAAAFSLVLAKLLRERHWDRILVALAPQADPAVVCDSLLAGPVGPHLSSIETVLLLERSSTEPFGRGRAVAAVQRADVVLILPSRGENAAGGALPVGFSTSGWPRGQAAALADEARMTDPGADPQVIEAPVDGPVDWRGLDRTLTALREPGRWRWRRPAAGHATDSVSTPEGLSCSAVPHEAGGLACAWMAPANRLFDRAILIAALAPLLLEPWLSGCQGVLRTRREWYLLTQTAAGADWRPSVSRRESRLECVLGPTAPAEARQRLHEALRGALVALPPESGVAPDSVDPS